MLTILIVQMLTNTIFMHVLHVHTIASNVFDTLYLQQAIISFFINFVGTISVT